MTEPCVETLLEHTRDALLAGDLTRLADLVGETEQALANGLQEDAPSAGRLRALAERNRPLLAAAIRGVKAAQRRAAEIAGHRTFATYDAQGNRDVFAPVPTVPALRV